MHRRLFLLYLGTGLATISLPNGHVLASEDKPLRIGMSPVFLHDSHGLMAEWKAYLSKRLKRQVIFVLRDSYGETMDLIKQHRLDAAWLCDYPYILMKAYVNLLATPLYGGRPYYRSYLIVSSQRKGVHSIADLEDKVFAYADPYSNTSYLAPRHALKQLGKTPDSFFRKTFFTWSHRKAIEAVAKHLADGAAVDSYVWESLARVEPEFTARTRIVSRSEEFGFPPFVVDRELSEETARDLRHVLMDMERDDEGRAILGKLNLTGFSQVRPEFYESVEVMVRQAGG